MNIDPIFVWLAASWPDVKGFFNSPFFTGIWAATAGAFAGAMGAQHIAEKSKCREQLTKEIRDTNAAMTVAASICGAMLNFKKQHVRRLKEEFDRERVGFVEQIRRRDAGEIPRGVVYQFQANLQTLTLPPLPVEILQKTIFERISVVGRPLTLATMVGQCIADLYMSIARRNSLIEDFKGRGPPLNANLYFGLRQGDVVNEEYPASMNAMSQQTDDCIFFSQLLVKDLIEHGTKAADEFTKEIGKGAPRVSVHDFSDAAKAGLMPDENLYSDWITKFKKHQDPPTLIAKVRTWLKRLQVAAGWVH